MNESVSQFQLFQEYINSIPHGMSFCPMTGLVWDPDLERQVLGPSPLGASDDHVRYSSKALDNPTLENRLMANIVAARESADEYKLPYGYCLVQMGMDIDDFYVERYA